MTVPNSSPAARRTFAAAIAVIALALGARPAHAVFHLWRISEVYSNASGSLQFIELRDDFGGQQFVSGQVIFVDNIGGTEQHSFTIPTDMPTNSLNHRLLLGTAGIQAAGAPAPDFIIPDNFLFIAGGGIGFFGLNGGGYTALPTDGVLSRTWGGGNAVNSPTNFAGQTGSIPAPGVALTAAAAGFISLGVRRRRAA